MGTRISKKALLAQFILCHSNATYDEWAAFQGRVPGLAVKTTGPKSQTILISMDAKMGWMTPEQWLNNHQPVVISEFVRKAIDACVTVSDLKELEKAMADETDGKIEVQFGTEGHFDRLQGRIESAADFRTFQILCSFHPVYEGSESDQIYHAVLLPKLMENFIREYGRDYVLNLLREIDPCPVELLNALTGGSPA